MSLTDPVARFSGANPKCKSGRASEAGCPVEAEESRLPHPQGGGILELQDRKRQADSPRVR